MRRLTLPTLLCTVLALAACDDGGPAAAEPDALPDLADTTGLDASDSALPDASDTSEDTEARDATSDGDASASDSDAAADALDMADGAVDPPGLYDATGLVAATDITWTGLAWEESVGAFPAGGALVFIEHRGRLELDTTAGPFVSDTGDPDDPPHHLVAVWLDELGSASRAETLARGRFDPEIHRLRDDLLVQGLVDTDAVLFPGRADERTFGDVDFSRVLLRVTPSGEVAWLGEVTGESGAGELSAIHEAADGALWVAGQSRWIDYTVAIDGLGEVTSPALPDDPGGFRATAWIARLAPGESPVVHRFDGQGSTHVNALATTADGEVWLCGDVGGFGEDMTVVLDPGGATETTLTALSPDDDPASDLFFARLGSGGEVEAAWLFYGYTNSLERPCDLQVLADGDLLVTARATPRYHEGADGEWDQSWWWVDSDGEVSTQPGSSYYDSATVTRYAPDGEVRWFAWHELWDQGRSPLLVGEQVIHGHSGYTGNTVFAHSATPYELGPPEDSYRSVRAALDLETGAPRALWTGGAAPDAVLANGLHLVATSEGETPLGDGESYTCPESEGRTLCLVTFVPPEVALAP